MWRGVLVVRRQIAICNFGKIQHFLLLLCQCSARVASNNPSHLVRNVDNPPTLTRVIFTFLLRPNQLIWLPQSSFGIIYRRRLCPFRRLSSHVGPSCSTRKLDISILRNYRVSTSYKLTGFIGTVRGKLRSVDKLSWAVIIHARQYIASKTISERIHKMVWRCIGWRAWQLIIHQVYYAWKKEEWCSPTNACNRRTYELTQYMHTHRN